MVEGPPRRYGPHARCGPVHSGCLIAGAGRTDAGREAGTDDWVGHPLRVDLADAAVAVGPSCSSRWASGSFTISDRMRTRTGCGLRRAPPSATVLWLLVSLLFKIYVANFTDYEGSVRDGGRRHRRTALVLCLGYCHPHRRRAERRNRTRIALRKAPRAKERARKAAARRTGGESVSAAATTRGAGAGHASSIGAVPTIEAWLGRGCRGDSADEVVESAKRPKAGLRPRSVDGHPSSERTPRTSVPTMPCYCSTVGVAAPAFVPLIHDAWRDNRSQET